MVFLNCDPILISQISGDSRDRSRQLKWKNNLKRNNNSLKTYFWKNKTNKQKNSTRHTDATWGHDPKV